MSLPFIGTVQYNGYNFNNSIKSEITSTPIQDEARRVTIGVRHLVDLKEWISAADNYLQTGTTTTDVEMLDIRRRLTQPGQILTISGKGFGNLIVNDPGIGVWDSEYGPIPRVVKWVSVGRELGCILHWQCETMIPECSNAVYQLALQSMNYQCNWSLEDGWTTRTVSGFLTIPATRGPGNDRTLQDQADDYREDIVPEVPLGFDRQTYVFELDKSKRRLDFRIVDKELPLPLPVGAKRARVRYSVESHTRHEGLTKWNASMSGTIHTPPQTPKTQAADIIAICCADRLTNNGKTLILEKLRFEEDLFGTETSFSVDWSLTSSRSQILRDSGMWQPVSGADFDTWAGSMAVAFAPRGNAEMVFKNSDDYLIDLCGQAPALANPETTPSILAPQDPGSPPPGEGNTIAAQPGDQSYLRYNCLVVPEQDQRTVRHKPLSDPSSGTPDLVQQLSPNTNWISLRGYAERVGAKPEIPALLSTGNNTLPVEYERNVRYWELGAQAGELMVYAAAWDILYISPEEPNDVPIPLNPVLHTPEEGGTGSNFLTTGATNLLTTGDSSLMDSGGITNTLTSG